MRIREDRERSGEPYEPEEREWEIIAEHPFLTNLEQYVICLDTLGQDREFTDEEKRFILESVTTFKNQWELNETEMLTRDRNRKLELIELDKEFLDNESAKLLEEEDKHVEELIGGMRDDIESDELKELYSKEMRVRFIARLYSEREEWKLNLFKLKEFKVLNIPRVMQSLFYFLKFERESICEPRSNKFFWKKAKGHIDEEFLIRL